jgi:hypothetical protein
MRPHLMQIEAIILPTGRHMTFNRLVHLFTISFGAGVSSSLYARFDRRSSLARQ